MQGGAEGEEPSQDRPRPGPGEEDPDGPDARPRLPRVCLRPRPRDIRHRTQDTRKPCTYCTQSNIHTILSTELLFLVWDENDKT